MPTSLSTSRAALPASLLVLAATGAFAGRGEKLPARPAADGAVGTFEALDESVRTGIEAGHVVTFAPVERRAEDAVEREAESIGTLQLPPESVRSLLAHVGGYPGWLPLDPATKRARVEGSSRFVRETGNVESPKPRRSETIEVSTDGEVVTWRIVRSSAAPGPGSLVSFRVESHPTMEGASVILRRQVDVVAPGATKDAGLDAWARDASRQARRQHWAMDAALRFPPGSDRADLYVEHYQRELGGRVPGWVNR